MLSRNAPARFKVTVSGEDPVILEKWCSQYIGLS